MPAQVDHSFDWRSAAAARGLVVTDLAEHVATSIEGIDLGDDHDEEMVAIIRAACVARTLLLFRGQEKLSPAGYLAFASRFGGRPDLHSLRHYCLPEHHEIFVVGNVHEDQTRVGSPKVGLNWHTDHYHLPEPGLFTYLHAIQVPDGQGDTRYANGIAAYEALPEAKRAEIDGLKVLHSRARLFRNLFPEASEEEAEAERRKIPDVVHPLVRTHPEIGKRGLYLGGEWGSCIDGMPADEGQALYEELLHHMIQDRFSYQHRWQPGDVLMSDNRCSLHRASEWDEETQVRRLHRIITIDDRAPY
ncbi:TauD/TfdA dioxygenase family protein [Reyranella sp.]|uniref:TauD/TfdA dioxygenase family protein n=1 Tax=Reyranella sp. TaxID=1929291 RepID=UPI003D0DA4E2